MAAAADLLIGEFVRTLDERFRLAIPPEMIDPLLAAGPKLVLAKERAGCLSLWSSAVWKPRLDAAVDVVRSKLQAGLLAQRMGQVQELGRLLSTRQQTVSLAGLHRQDVGGCEPVGVGTAHRREPLKVPTVEVGEVPADVGPDLVGVLLAPVAEVYREVADVFVPHAGIVERPPLRETSFLPPDRPVKR